MSNNTDLKDSLLELSRHITRLENQLKTWLEKMEKTNWEVSGSSGPDDIFIEDMQFIAAHLQRIANRIVTEAEPVNKLISAKEAIALSNTIRDDIKSNFDRVFNDVLINKINVLIKQAAPKQFSCYVPHRTILNDPAFWSVLYNQVFLVTALKEEGYKVRADCLGVFIHWG